MIETSELIKRFGSFTAVDRLNLKINEGEVFGFLGANGAGKTTTIRILCGLLKPTSGKASVAGFDVSNQSEKVKRSIGYMSQKFALYDDLRLRENLQFYGGLYGLKASQSMDKAQPYLHKLGLEGHTNDYVRDIPLGYKQRLALVCALVHDPPVVFLDEPTSGVDPQARREFWSVISTLAAQGKTVIVSTHYMDEAEYCHRVVVMRSGLSVAQGVPAELKKQYGVRTMQDLFLLLARNKADN
jgi:ABC-2 type transport system ATP-binding protein